jgi:hypothetical protein
MAGPTGLEPATSDVTGQRSSQLNYDPANCDCHWWAVLVSNQRPHPCKGCALPPELTALDKQFLYKTDSEYTLPFFSMSSTKGLTVGTHWHDLYTKQWVSKPFEPSNKPFVHLRSSLSPIRCKIQGFWISVSLAFRLRRANHRTQLISPGSLSPSRGRSRSR